MMWVVLLLLMPTLALAAPSISGTSGTTTHGSTITISGTGFGSKGGTNANKPLIWADFESSINPTSLGHITAWDSNANLVRTTGGTQYGLSGSNIVGTRSAGVLSFSLQLVHTFDSKLYATGKRRYSDFSGSPNYKFFRFNNDVPASFVASTSSGGIVLDESFTTQVDRFQGTDPVAGVWRMEEFEWRKATTSCSAGSANGYWRMVVNASVNQELNGTLCSTTTANYGADGGLRVFDNFDTDGDLPNGTQIFMDDIYIDDTWAHVIIGNASTLAASTVREVQIPSSWSDTSIVVTVNRGSFGESAGAWLFVVDANNGVSSGHAITFGAGGGGGGTASPGGMDLF